MINGTLKIVKSGLNNAVTTALKADSNCPVTGSVSKPLRMREESMCEDPYVSQKVQLFSVLCSLQFIFSLFSVSTKSIPGKFKVRNAFASWKT